MALQPGIILSGQQFDLAGSMGAGNQLAAQTNALREQNALRDVYRTQGAGILQGNPQSLNALAAIDPMTALNAQGGVISNQTASRRLEILNAEEKRQIAAAAAQMSEAQKAEAAAKVKQQVLGFISAPTPEIFDQMVTQAGKPELAGMWENRQVLGAEYVSSVEEALKLSRGPAGPELPDSIQALQFRAQAAGLAPGTPEYASFMERGGAKPGPETSVTINNAGDDKFSEAFAKEDATALNVISTAGIAAQRNIGRIDQLGKLLTASPSGAGAAVQQFLGERGIPTEGLDEIQAVQAAINSLVPEQRQPGSGPMSDADLALFKQSLPRVINQPGGNQMIVQTMRAIAQYDAEGAQIVQRLRAGELTRAQAFDALQNRKNPLEDFKVATGQTETPAVPDGLTEDDLQYLGTP